MNNPGDLGGLHDIVAPSHFPFWPLAPGVWVLIAGLGAILLLQVWQAWRRYRANAYRRAALRELDAVAASATGDGADDVLRISAILKRVALVSYPRERVASLSGELWQRFIADQAGRGTDVSLVTSELAGAVGEGERRGPAQTRALVAAAKAWVRRHRAAKGE